MPLQRIKKILDILDSPVIITDTEHAASIKALASTDKIFLYEEIITSKIAYEKLNDIRRNVIDMDPLYILFTSGSTGMPKGVVVSHQSVIEYTEWVTKTFHITSQDSFGNQAPFYFDNSILDIYCGLKNSSTVYIIPKNCFVFPIELLKYLNEKKITTIFFCPVSIMYSRKIESIKKHSIILFK